MLTVEHRATLAKLGIASDLRVRCWFTLTGGTHYTQRFALLCTDRN